MKMSRVQSPSSQARELLPNTWDKQPGESRQAYEALEIFLALPGDRCIEDVADRLSCSPGRVRVWATKWRWHDRARAWDSHLGEIATDAEIRERREMRDRQVKLGVMMQDLASYGLKELEEKMERNQLKLKPLDAVRLVEVGARLEKAARGEEGSTPAIIEVIFGDVDEESWKNGV